MPANPDLYRTNWIVDPETGSFQLLVDGNPTNTSASLEDISGGAYRLDPVRAGDILGYVRDLSTGRLYSTITLEQPAVMNVNQAGDISLLSPVDRENINEKIFAQGKYGASANIQLELPTGESPQFNVTSWLTRENDRLLVREGSAPGDIDRYRYSSEFRGKELYDPTAPGSGWRYASPDEALNRGLIGRIIEENRQLVDDMVALGVPGIDGQPVRTPYAAAEVIATQQSDLSVQRVTTLE
jgi:hypothetical protein